MSLIINGSNTPTAGSVAVGDGTTLGFTAVGTAGQVLTSNGAGVPTWTDNGSGTVTSVSGTGTVSGLSLSGTVTTSGSLTLGGTLAVTPSNFSSQTANYILAAPNGTAGVPTFRAIVAADIPTLNQNTTGTAANVTGTVAIANGGSGTTTAQGAMNAFAGATTSGSYLRGNGTNVVMSTIQAADVPTLNQNTTGTASNVTGIVAIANGGTGIGSSGGATGAFYAPTSVSAPQFGTLPVTVGGTGATTLTGILKGNGSSAFTAATAGTDYVVPNGALGTPSSGTLSSCTVDGTNAVGFRSIPPVGTKTSSYTLATGDVGKYVQVGSGGSIVVPDATFSEGNAVSIFNNTTGSITITLNITTAYIAGTDSDKASVSLATRGVANILFISGTICVVTGNVS